MDDDTGQLGSHQEDALQTSAFNISKAILFVDGTSNGDATITKTGDSGYDNGGSPDLCQWDIAYDNSKSARIGFGNQSKIFDSREGDLV